MLIDTLHQSGQWDIIESSMIFRPATLMPCNDRSRGFNLGSFNYPMATSIRFWIIPYSTVDINGYDIAEVDIPELRDMESTLHDINASMDNNISDEGSVSSVDENR